MGLCPPCLTLGTPAKGSPLETFNCLREQGGRPHMDPAKGKPLEPHTCLGFQRRAFGGGPGGRAPWPYFLLPLTQAKKNRQSTIEPLNIGGGEAADNRTHAV